MLRISDTLVFDVLVEDHDRKWDFNWKETHDGLLLHWDSGLGWRHGPVASEKCLEILCAHTKWRERDAEAQLPKDRVQINEKTMQDAIKKAATDPSKCSRISVFRNSTIEFLRAHGPSVPEEKRLSRMWLKAVTDNEALSAEQLLSFGSFWTEPRSITRSRLRFDAEIYARGLDQRIEWLLDWVDHSVALHGAHSVLLS